MNAKGMKPIATKSVSHYTTKLSYTGSNLTYIGKAEIGTATTANGWQIKKVLRWWEKLYRDIGGFKNGRRRNGRTE